MHVSHIPIHHPRPDAASFVNILTGRQPSVRVPLVEYIVDDVVMRPVVTDLLGKPWRVPGADRSSQKAYLDMLIDFWYRMGYDFIRFEISLPFQEKTTLIEDAAPASSKDRAWQDEHHGAIMTWEDFERYSWPRVEDFDFFPFEYINANLPEGMGLISSHGGGVYEHLSWIMSYEGLAMSMYDAPDLAVAVTDKLGSLMEGFYRNLLTLEKLIAVFPGDDMGYKTATLISPADLRRLVLPWHKKFAARTHEKGLPYFLHSCGNIFTIMDDLIHDVGINGKHSYEDAILPVETFQERYGSDIAVLGGLDINILSGKTPDDVRARTKSLIETCGARGRYAVGSGNSVPSYVPVDNYLAMIDQAHAMGARS